MRFAHLKTIYNVHKRLISTSATRISKTTRALPLAPDVSSRSKSRLKERPLFYGDASILSYRWP